MKAYARQFTENEFYLDSHIHNRLDGSALDPNLKLSAEERWELDQQFFEPRDLLFFRNCWVDRLPQDHKNRLFMCEAGQTTFVVDPYGRLSPCVVYRRQTFDLRAGDFDAGFQEFLPSFAGRRRSRPSPCAECELINLCESCPAHNWLETGDEETIPEDYCRLTKIRHAQATELYQKESTHA
jgi:radical SAM protein with 4Fe4S-binding SPASM domain